MLLDDQILFSGAKSGTGVAGQSMASFTTGSNASTDLIQVNDGLAQQWLGRQVYFFFVITTAVTGTTSTVDFRLETDSTSAFSSAAILTSTGAIAEATLVAGYRRFLPLPPENGEQYLRVNYVVANNNLSAGVVIAGLTLDPTAWTSYPNAYTV